VTVGTNHTNARCGLNAELCKVAAGIRFVTAVLEMATVCLIYPESDEKFFRELRCSGVLRHEEWEFVTDVSGQPIGPVFYGEESFWALFCILEP
jgi:hypothetical protein